MLPDAAENAQLRRVPKPLEELQPRIDATVSAVLDLSQSDSDITGQLRLDAEYGRSLGDATGLEIYNLTDGFQNVGIKLDDKT